MNPNDLIRLIRISIDKVVILKRHSSPFEMIYLLKRLSKYFPNKHSRDLLNEIRLKSGRQNKR